MNNLRLFINEQLNEEDIHGCVVHTDIFHKKIQQMALDLLEVEKAGFLDRGTDPDNDYELLLKYLAYCPYDYEAEEYSEELEVPAHILHLGRGFMRKAIASFLEDIRD